MRRIIVGLKPGLLTRLQSDIGRPDDLKRRQFNGRRRLLDAPCVCRRLDCRSERVFSRRHNEVAAAGYTAGGETLTVVPPAVANGVAFIPFDNVTWTSALTARAALIYLDDGLLKPTVCVLDFGSDKTSTTTFTVTFPAALNTSAIIRIA